MEREGFAPSPLPPAPQQQRTLMMRCRPGGWRNREVRALGVYYNQLGYTTTNRGVLQLAFKLGYTTTGTSTGFEGERLEKEVLGSPDLPRDSKETQNSAVAVYPKSSVGREEVKVWK